MREQEMDASKKGKGCVSGLLWAVHDGEVPAPDNARRAEGTHPGQHSFHM